MAEKKNKELVAALQRRTEAVFPSQTAVLKRLETEAPLKIYLGIDPTGPDVHLGHVIPLLLLKQLAQAGHHVTVLVGDFTARIGDPTGKSTARQPLTVRQVEQNASTYVSQIKKIFGSVSFETRTNSEWLASMDLSKVIDLASRVTVQQMIVRDMFQERLRAEKPIHVHEFLYPLMHGYDSVAMEVDGEVGGNDQTFNMLVGRDLAKEYLGKDKLVLATKLLVDPASGRKMSKSEGSLIALNDEPQEIRRKVLALDDAIIKPIFELCTEKEQSWIDEQFSSERNPREHKEELASVLVGMFHGAEAVSQANQARVVDAAGKPLLELLILPELGLVNSKSHAKDLIKQKSVIVNDETITDWNHELKKGDQVKIGKGKFVQIK